MRGLFSTSLPATFIKNAIDGGDGKCITCGQREFLKFYLFFSTLFGIGSWVRFSQS
jgi:hypothetical protein